MFSRIGLTALGRCSISKLETPSNSPIIQIVRWRKRRWAPKNASKIYVVREPTPVNPEERAELAWRYRHYKTSIRGLWAYFKEEVAAKEAAKSSQVLTDKEEAEWAKLMKINAEWNQDTGKLREARQAEEERISDGNRQATLVALEEKKLAELLQAQRLVQEEIEMSKHFIRPDDLDAEIEKALNSRVSYNYAVDTEGNRYVELSDGTTVAETKEAETVRRFEHTDEENAHRLEN